ncbi:uncharacterized protein LOC108914603 [Anoplophora glabripennis]|uniref:uncharacterized protein LOC108914603 n=1 Tax=Anoplophora glabripennis TaxID=217634 RepID=UPI000873CA1B|nr:uncharacterized protein LOC108914603 [Anoplophora glabripennis]
MAAARSSLLDMSMKRWLKYLFIATIFGFVKAHQFIRLVILASLGLAGLWMVHTLAQDYNKIQTGGGDATSSGGDTRIFKRSVEAAQSHRIDWETILSKDPASCTRSFICQLAATDREHLSKEELLMLELSRDTLEKESWASKELQEAINHGQKVKQPNQCMKIYKYCPFTSQMMLTLLKMFSR